MEQKTKITAEVGQHDLFITRDFDLPVELLFKAHAEPELFEQWMSHEWGTTKMVEFEAHDHGSYKFETSDAQGKVMFMAHGTFHAFTPNEKIVRTFEMGEPFGVQLEFLVFEKLTDDTSRLTMQSIYKSPALRDELLKLPFKQGLEMAHNRLQDIIQKLK